MPTEQYAATFLALTGIEYTWDDLLKVSERVYNLTRAFNVREIPGYGREYDMPPARTFEDTIPDGPSAGAVLTLDTINALMHDLVRSLNNA